MCLGGQQTSGPPAGLQGPSVDSGLPDPQDWPRYLRRGALDLQESEPGLAWAPGLGMSTENPGLGVVGQPHGQMLTFPYGLQCVEMEEWVLE